MNSLMESRRCGVLLHPTSLPGAGSTGTLGLDAQRFVDFLSKGGFSVWQMLPVGPVDSVGSPYGSSSTYAGDVRLIDPLTLDSLPELPVRLPFECVREAPAAAYSAFKVLATSAQRRQFDGFIRRHQRWVFPFGIFEVCRKRFDGEPWWRWPEPFRHRDWNGLVDLVAQERDAFRAIVFQQYLFELQWSALKRYANGRGVFLFGDLPFYVDRNSVDVWWSRRFFALDENLEPSLVAGVPPDYFNDEGQFWGNPLYDWAALRREGFDWWRARLEAQFLRFDLLRIDHFRALESYWAIPAGASSAREGRWEPGCGDELLEQLHVRDGMPLVAEDLGIITDEVRALRDRFGLPGMAVLQFGFDGSADNPHLPQNHVENSVVYTGTHDNDTLRGWYATLDEGTRDYVKAILRVTDEPMPQYLVEVAYASRARLAVIPLQDLMGLGSAARMNTPGQAEGNWRWRFCWDDLEVSLATRSQELARMHNRLA